MSRGWIIGLTVAPRAVGVSVDSCPARLNRMDDLAMMAVPFVLIGGFIIAAICGYMAGLIGASNSPVSGVGILSIVSCATFLVFAFPPTAETRPSLVAFALFVTAIVFACATISNDNLQDLKTDSSWARRHAASRSRSSSASQALP
jgi:putative OPT family oligopeptide transporter